MVITNNNGQGPISSMTFTFPEFDFELKYVLKKINTKGNLVYEYNPFRNYRISKDCTINGIDYKAGMLVDFDTTKLQFDLEHPVDIECQTSYDGSVNLILNDDLTQPKLINSRFTPLESNTYKVIDRVGNNDTNIYDENQFNIDTSLYKRTIAIPKVDFTGLGTDGNLPVGNYAFYFKYCDADGNETDFIEESGIVSCHIGNLNDPFSIRGGIRDENSKKSANFVISNADSNYEYLVVYGTRSTSDVDGNEVTTAFRINKQYLIRSSVAYISITGHEVFEQVPISDINAVYNVVSSIKAQTQCQNMLFFGNVNKPELDYKQLTDLSLRFLPYIDTSANIGKVNDSYYDSTGGYEYYNAMNIYNKLGYWNDIYRLGVVYLLDDNTLSPAFNIRGKDAVGTVADYTNIPVYETVNGEQIRKFIPINEEDYSISDSSNYLENSKGVIRIAAPASNSHSVLGIKIKADKEVITELSKYVKGFFFVRQKRIPTILAQSLVIGLERESCLPTIPLNNGKYLLESFINERGVLDHSFNAHKREVDSKFVLPKAALCPEYELRKSYFNNLFTGSDFVIGEAQNQPTNKFQSTTNDRVYSIKDYISNSLTSYQYGVRILGVADNTQLLVSKNQKYRARIGAAEEAWRFGFIEKETLIDYDKTKDNNVIRGSFGSYLGIDNYTGDIGRIINIYIPGYSQYNMRNYFSMRYDDSLPYYAIGRRIDISDIESLDETFYRGDCFICNYTHRMHRNFQDSDAPTNDMIVDPYTWKNNYKKGDDESNAKINRGDLNAVQIGHWVTMKVYSSSNLSMRDIDRSISEEEALTGVPRNFFPLYSPSVGGESKIPESAVINSGFNSTTSDRYNYILPNVPAIKNEFDTRILYSDININDAFKNGFRVFRMQNYRDFPKTYGGIIKLIELFGNILCVFEHGVALIPVNERAVAGDGAGGNVFINTSNVLPENPKMLSDTFGSQWADSVVKTPYYVYGVDTVGRKIWRTNGSQFEVISDFKVQKFLNDNISLSERELTPIIGIRNVKTHYNAFKQDIMFTFYDNLYGFEEKAWNLCYNEIMQKFITFYSWIPSFSANINNILFTFDRNTSKNIAKLWLGTDNDGISISNNIASGALHQTIGELRLSDIRLPQVKTVNIDGVIKDAYTVKYTLERDNFGNYKFFTINKDNKLVTTQTLEDKVYMLNIKAEISFIRDFPPSLKEFQDTFNAYQTLNSGYYQNSIAICTRIGKDNLTTDFWKHGQAGIIDISDKIKPTYWYNKQHPFEFEFVVVDGPGTHKIFENLEVISNKAKPESFHFEVAGEVYNFAEDKKNMYFRQEATKHLYQYNGSNIIYNHNYLDIVPEQRDMIYSPSGYKDKSTMFPLTYSRVDTFNEIEDHYQEMRAPNKDYQHLSGSEIVYYEDLDEYRIATHIKGMPFKGWYSQEISKTSYDESINNGYRDVYIKDGKFYRLLQYGRLRGNMDYLEDKWTIQIPSITYWQKNESEWQVISPERNHYPPINLANSPIPEDLTNLNLATNEDIPKQLRNLGYNLDLLSLDINKWSDERKETRIRDKYIKIKVRYTGDDLAVILALKTLYTISYA